MLQLEEPGDTKRMVVVEAKFHSGKSAAGDIEDNSSASRDQLAREWTCLQTEAALWGATPVLIYLTPHFATPTDDISTSLAGSLEEIAPVISWLAWRCLTAILAATADPLLRDLHASLVRLGLEFFSGFPDIHARGPILWTFEDRWDWPAATPNSIAWRFT